jgi:hypothetical protein
MGLAEGLVSIRFSIFHQLKSRFNYHQTPGRAHRILLERVRQMRHLKPGFTKASEILLFYGITILYRMG